MGKTNSVNNCHNDIMPQIFCSHKHQCWFSLLQTSALWAPKLNSHLKLWFQFLNTCKRVVQFVSITLNDMKSYKTSDDCTEKSQMFCASWFQNNVIPMHKSAIFTNSKPYSTITMCGSHLLFTFWNFPVRHSSIQHLVRILTELCYFILTSHKQNFQSGWQKLMISKPVFMLAWSFYIPAIYFWWSSC